MDPPPQLCWSIEKKPACVNLHRQKNPGCRQPKTTHQDCLVLSPVGIVSVVRRPPSFQKAKVRRPHALGSSFRRSPAAAPACCAQLSMSVARRTCLLSGACGRLCFRTLQAPARTCRVTCSFMCCTPATREAHAHDGERMGRMYGLPAAMVRRYSDVFCYTMHTEYTCLTDSQLSHASLVQ